MSNSVVEDLVGRARGLRASRALGTRGRLSRRCIAFAGRAGSTSLGGRCTTDVIEGHRGVTADAGGATGDGSTRANSAGLIDVAGLLGERTFTVESASLPGNQLPGLLLRHVLVSDGNLSEDSYVENLLAQVQRKQNGLQLCCSKETV